MLADHICRAALFMVETVLTWAMDHLESLTASSEEKEDPSSLLAFGASYVPSKHVVSHVDVAADPASGIERYSRYRCMIQQEWNDLQA
jgi:hypothetical protein